MDEVQESVVTITHLKGGYVIKTEVQLGGHLEGIKTDHEICANHHEMLEKVNNFFTHEGIVGIVTVDPNAPITSSMEE